MLRMPLECQLAAMPDVGPLPSSSRELQGVPRSQRQRTLAATSPCLLLGTGWPLRTPCRKMPCGGEHSAERRPMAVSGTLYVNSTSSSSCGSAASGVGACRGMAGREGRSRALAGQLPLLHPHLRQAGLEALARQREGQLQARLLHGPPKAPLAGRGLGQVAHRRLLHELRGYVHGQAAPAQHLPAARLLGMRGRQQRGGVERRLKTATASPPSSFSGWPWVQQGSAPACGAARRLFGRSGSSRAPACSCGEGRTTGVRAL